MNTKLAWKGTRSRARPTTNGNAARRPANSSQPARDPSAVTATPKTSSSPSDYNLVQPRHQHDRTTRGIHIRRVPSDVWRRARTNALRSGLPFREFVIALLAECEPRDTTT